MAALGPFGPRRQVIAAVSGGPDSMALAWLLQRWGDPLAVVVDHGLRPESVAEAALTMTRLAALHIPARLVTLAVKPGPDVGARARAARYHALLSACRDSGRPDLCVGQHRQDLADTMLLRRASGSGAAGLAGMAALSWRGDARVLRPFLALPPSRLRATLQSAGVGWVEDPGNTDPNTARGGLRAQGVPDGAADVAVRWGVVRQATERRVADELARHVAIYPTGHAVVQGALSARAWSALVWTVSGRAFPPPRAAVRTMMAAGGGTLHGVMVRGAMVMREPAAVAPPARLGSGSAWDGRFAVVKGPAGGTVSAAGVLPTRLRRRSGLPSLVTRTLPALAIDTDLFVVPHLAYLDDDVCPSVELDFRPPHPLAGAPFVSGGHSRTARDAHGDGAPHVG